MKFSTATVLVLANGIAAMPSMPWSKNVAQKEEITLRVEVAKEATMTDWPEACWRACFGEGITCPEGTHSKQLGDCWTCCADGSHSVKTKEVAAKKMTVAKSEAICWLACFSQQPTCPEAWYAQQQGECWTCCKDIPNANEVKQVKAKELSLKDFATPAHTTEPEICWAVCWGEKPQCPESSGWYPKSHNDCWTCCKDLGADSVQKPKSKELNLKQFKPAVSAKAEDICWLICAYEPLSCPEGWYSKEIGDCNTCCRSSDEAQLRLQL